MAPTPKRRGRPDEGLDSRLLLRAPSWLRKALQEAAKRQGITESHAWRAAALLWLGRDAPRGEADEAAP